MVMGDDEFDVVGIKEALCRHVANEMTLAAKSAKHSEGVVQFQLGRWKFEMLFCDFYYLVLRSYEVDRFLGWLQKKKMVRSGRAPP